MKTIAIIILAASLTSCGLPFNVRIGYLDKDNGIDLDAGYSSKHGITTGIDYTASK